MMEWILYMWLASAPAVLQPVGQYNSRAECLTARREEIGRNMQLRLGGGATYLCLREE